MSNSIRGTIVAIGTDGEISATEVTDSQILPHLHRITGGHIESVPHWNTYTHQGRVHDCVAFCNTDGKLKRLAVNHVANALWRAQFPHSGDFLVGNIAVVFGSPGFMRRL